MRYSIQPRDRIFVKYCGFLSFAKNMGKNIDNNISKPLIGKYSHKPIYQSSKRVIQKTAEATGNLIGNKISNKVTNISKICQQKNSGTLTNEEENIGLDREYLKKDIYL